MPGSARINLRVGYVLLTWIVSGCDGSSSPSESSVLAADVVAMEDGAWTNCQEFLAIEDRCDFVGEGRNRGQGCAVLITGVTRFYDASGQQLGPTKSWTGPAFLRPSEAFTYLIEDVSRWIVEDTETYQSEAAWTDSAC